jgi:hypothetical protein
MSVNVDEVISAYMTLRSRKESIEAEAKEKVASVKEKMAKLEAWIKTQADAQGVTSFKTKHGTAFLTTVDYASVADWDSLLGFIKEREAYDLLEKRVSKISVRSYIDGEKIVPPGVNYGTKLEVNIRKPSTRVDD